jgi:hypothetical protein
MKGCNSPDEFDSAIELGKAINKTHPDQTQDESLHNLDTTSDVVSKIEGKYQTPTGKAQIKESVTEVVSKKMPYNGPENPRLDQQGEIGNFMHDVNQDVMQILVDEIKDMSNNAAIAHVTKAVLTTEGLKKSYKEYGKSLDPKSELRVLEGARVNLLSILKRQQTINILSGKDGRVKIRLEQVVIDPRRAIGGTIDFLAIYSNNTASILDYKTKFMSGYNQDEFGNIIDMKKIAGKETMKRYKLQLGEYGRVLREAYGIKEIASSDIVPVTINVNFNTKTGKYATRISNVKYPGQDPLLEKILPFSPTTNFKDLDELVRGIDKQLEKLEDKIKNNPTRRDELQDRIDTLDRARKDLLLNHNLDSILDYAQSLGKNVTKAEMGELSIQELQELIEELELLSTLSKATLNYREFLKTNSEKDEFDRVKTKIAQVTGELEETLATVREVLFNGKVTKLIELHTGYKVTDDMGNFLPMTQEGFFGKWFYQLSQHDNPVFQTLRSILDEINYDVRERTDLVVEDIVSTENKVHEWLKATGRTFNDLVDIMIDKTKDNFWGKYNSEYTDTVRGATATELYKYFEPFDNHDERYSNKLMEKLAEIKAQNLSGPETEHLINTWISKNSLAMDSGKPLYPEAWAKAKKFNRLKFKDNSKEYNKNYQFILSVPELKAYYEMFEKYNNEFREKLGVDYTSLPNNFLPNVRKAMSERITDQGFNGFLSGTSDFFKDFSIREDDRSMDESYNSNAKIPIFFMMPFKSKDGELQVGEKSYQFGRSLAIFAKMAYNYEATTAREAEILALQQFLDSEAESFEQSRGRNLIDKMGNNLTEKLQATDTPEIFRSFVDMYIYKIGVKPIIGDKSGKAEKMLLKAKEYFTLKALGLNVVAGTASFVSAKINAMIESNKGVIFNSKNYKESMVAGYAEREKFLALNAYFDVMGHRISNPRIKGEKTLGEVTLSDPTMRGWINKYVNSRMLMNTFSLGDQYIEELVTVAMAKNYYIDEKGNLRRIKNNADLELHKDRLVWNLFTYDREAGAKLDLTKEQLRNVYEDFRRAVQAGQSRIKGTISDEDKAHWQNNIIMQMMMHFKSWMPGLFFERFGKVKFDNRIDSLYMGKFTALAKEFGGIDQMAMSEFMTKIVLPKMGKLIVDIATLGLFKSSRLNDKYNKELYFEKWLDENPHHRGKVSFEDFNEIQQKQLKSVIQELRVILLFAGLLMLMAGDWDDDGERDYNKYLMTRKIASLLFKTRQEIYFMYRPDQFASMIKNPIPSLGLLTDAFKTISATGSETYDLLSGKDAFLGWGNEKSDKTPRGYQLTKWLPGLGGALRFFDFFNSDVAYSKTQQ